MAWPAIGVMLYGGAKAIGRRAQAAAIGAAVVSGMTYMFKTKLGLFVLSAMVWLGINWGTIKLVIDPAVELLLGYADGSLGGGGNQYASVAVQWMGVLNFDRAITMVVSAVVTKHAVMQGRLFLFKRGVGA